MEHLSLVPNLNLRRLIKDLLSEGGEGLYIQSFDAADGTADGRKKKKPGRGSVDSSSSSSGHQAEYRFALVPEHIAILKVCGMNYSWIEMCRIM